MAVYEHSYRRYTGPTTPTWSRFLVMPRYAFKDVFQSRLLVSFFAMCLIVPVLFAAVIYLRQNAENLPLVSQTDLVNILSIDASFFQRFLLIQGYFAFFLTLFVGPGLISRDLANNALPLYLSRPLARAEYVLGKLSVLLVLLSLITWVPALLLFALNGNFLGWRWMLTNARIATAGFVASWLWILLLATLVLALSAWVRWRTVAGFLLLMIFLSGGFLSLMVNMLYKATWGHLLNPARLIRIVSAHLFGLQPPEGPPLWGACLVLGLLATFSLWLLHRKIRAYEVVS